MTATATPGTATGTATTGTATTGTATTGTATIGPPPVAVPITRTVARHSGVVAVQVAAGFGNLAFSIAAVRLLPAPEYAQFAAFLAAYLLINTPAASLTAGASLRPELARRLRPLMLRLGVAAGVLIAASTPWLTGPSRLPPALLLLLAADAPAAGLLALARGSLFGQHRLVAAATGIVSEPLARCAVGLALVPIAGSVGAAAGVVTGGYAALLVCLALGRRKAVASEPAPGPAAAAPGTVLAFLLFAVVGAQDVIVANRALRPADAGVFAAASTLGGAVLFATASVPLVVLAQLRRGHRHTLAAALGVTLVASLAATAVLTVLPVRILARVLGDTAAPVAAILPTYLAAMVLLCLTRVLLAALCTRGLAGWAAAAGVAAAGVQVMLLVRAESPAEAAQATLVAAGVLLVLSGALTLLPAAPATPAVLPAPAPTPTALPVPVPVPAPAAPVRRRRLRRAWRRADLTWVVSLCLAGLAIRLSTDRSVWIDEAISVHEASQPYPTMLQTLRVSDVHPPLYFTLLWGVIHATGSTAETVVRIPSLLPGTLLVAMAYAAARDLWDRRTARFAGVIAAIGPAAVWYSQDARMYALFMLFSVVAGWMLIRVLRDGRWRDAATFTVACALMMWTQYDTALPVATMFATLVGVAVTRVVRSHRWRLLAQAVVSAILMAAALIPLVPWVQQQYGHTAGLTTSLPSQAGQAGQTGAASAGVNAYSVLADGVWAIFGYHSNHAMLLINAFWPVLLLLVLAMLGRGGSLPGKVLGAIAVVPPAALFLVAQRRSDMFDLRYFSATVPALNLLLARMVASWPRGRLTRLLVPAALVTALGAGLVDEQINASNPRVYDFRGAVAYIRAHAHPDDLLLYGPSYLDNELDYYQPGIRIEPITGPPQTGGSGHVFVLGSFLDEKATAGRVGTAVSVLTQNRHLVAKIQFPNVTVWEYE